jgi:uncharacterized phiE125 gp8 family phage protein
MRTKMEIISQSEVLPVGLEKAKQHLRVTNNSDDSLIETLIRAACYKAEQVTWREIVEREVYIEDANETGVVSLGTSPIKSIDKVEQFTDEWVEVTEDDYTLVGKSLITEIAPVRVLYTTLIYSNPDINRLVLDLVAVYYDHRPDEEMLEANVVMKLSKYKVWQAG